MRRARSLLVFVGVLAAFAGLPGAAAAANFTWDLNSDFSTAPPANPDADHYSRTPWSYEEGGRTLPMANPTPGFSGGLIGWSESQSSAPAPPFVAINPGATPITDPTTTSTTYPAGQVAMRPSQTQPAVIAWTAPVSGPISIVGSVAPDDSGSLTCPSDATWQLSGPGGLSQSSGPISTTANVTSGDRITLTLSPGPLDGVLGTACDSNSVTITITAVAPTPSVTLASPANGATITDGQPTFSGKADTAFGSANTVTVHVYNGASATGTPVRDLPATVSGDGSYSIAPSPPLPDGTYTAQTEQDSIIPGPKGLSSANTFTLRTAPATVTLDSPGSRPLTSSSPTITGIAAPNQPVTIKVYPGGTTAGSLVGTATGSSAADGSFSIQLPALPDGQYTVIASDGAGGSSAPVTFRIKVHAPALTLTQPIEGGYLSQGGPMFLGAAGNSLGDAPQVAVTLYGGSSSAAKNLGTQRATQAGGSWTLGWPQRLALGTYTVRVSQSDDAGHTTSVTHTFQIVAANSSVGPTVEISPTGQASVPMWCAAPVGRSCSGTVLILTKKTYRAAGGGLAGRLRVMFAYVTIPGGGSIVVSRQVQSDVLRALRRARTVPVLVVAALRSAGGSPRSVGVSRVVTVRSARHR